MRKILTEIGIIAILAFLVSILFLQVLTVRKTIDENNQLKQKVDYLNQEIGLYENNEEWFEDYIELIEEIYEGKINEAVLEERIYWLEKDNINYYDAEFVETLMDDVETFTEYLISYVKLNGTDNGFEAWLIKNDKPLYDKMMYYDDIYEENH